MDLERLRGHRDWSRKMKKGDLGTERTQEAGFPRKLALWIGKDGFSYTTVSAKRLLFACTRLTEMVVYMGH